MRRALFVVDDRPEAGLGHVVRCGALRAELEARGWECVTHGSAGMRTDDTLAIASFGAAVVDVGTGAGTWRIASEGPRLASVMVADVVPAGAKDVDLLVCGSAGATPEMFADCGAKRVLAGPQYALLRPEFRSFRVADVRVPSDARLTELDLRAIGGLSATQLAALLAEARVCGATVHSYGGMRALEAACVMGECAGRLCVEPRNEGERLNASGLVDGVCVDGLGVGRVADAIEEMVA